jgi:hypothetical protein
VPELRLRIKNGIVTHDSRVFTSLRANLMTDGGGYGSGVWGGGGMIPAGPSTIRLNGLGIVTEAKA